MEDILNKTRDEQVNILLNELIDVFNNKTFSITNAKDCISQIYKIAKANNKRLVLSYEDVEG